SSSSVGFFGSAYLLKVNAMMGSGNFPPCCWYSAFTRWKRSARTQWSCRALPCGGMTWSFHCDQRPLLTKEPSFSIQCVVGTMNTSVWIDFVSAPGRRQNSELVVGAGSITTRHLRFAGARITRLESDPMLVTGLPDR